VEDQVIKAEVDRDKVADRVVPETDKVEGVEAIQEKEMEMEVTVEAIQEMDKGRDRVINPVRDQRKTRQRNDP
jgi:hypothetical protein